MVYFFSITLTGMKSVRMDNILDIRKIIDGDEYSFLKTNSLLKDNLIYLTFGGSIAYGTNIASSDIDIRGVCFNTKADLLGNQKFEQYVDEYTDTTIYSFNKLINLLTECNPNTIEMIGVKDYLSYSPVADQLMDNKKMFLSKRAAISFGGYANQQLRRLQNALAHDKYPKEEKERHILGSIQSAMMSFNDRYSELPKDKFFVYIKDDELSIDVDLDGYPLRDYKNIISDLNAISKNYDKLNKRNKKKDDLHLNKHAMHLIRLYNMCLDILEKEEVNTYRTEDHDLLMSIRDGEYQNEDGTFKKEFFELVTDLEKKVEYAKEHTALPEAPDYKRIEEFQIAVNEEVIVNSKD